MKKLIAFFICCASLSYGAATPIANLAISTDANGRGNSWTNLADVVLTNGVRLSTVSGGGGSGTFTNLQWGTNNNTAQALIRAESNIVFRSAGGTNYAALAGNLTGDFTFNGAINANDNIEIVNTKHLRFQDGGGTNTVHLAATAGRLIVTGAVDIVTAQAVPATINGAQIATASDVAARLASNVWAAADSTTNYFRRTGDSVPYISFAIASPPLNNATTIGYGLNGRGDSDFVIFQTEANGTYFDLVNPVTFNGLVISDVGFSGDGSGLTNLSAFSTIRTNGSGNVVTNLTFGGSVITQQMGTVTSGGGAAGNQRSFEWRDSEGSLNVGWTKTLAPGVNLVSVRTATNDLTFAAYGTTPSTTLQTNTLYVTFNAGLTGSIPWAVKASQAVSSGLVIFTPKDGQTMGVAITQALAAASTHYQTNQPLSITARTASVEVRIMTTNSANLFQLGVDVQ